jgi:hypothetical protein
LGRRGIERKKRKGRRGGASDGKKEKESELGLGWAKRREEGKRDRKMEFEGIFRT